MPIETPKIFSCRGETVLGILHESEPPSSSSNTNSGTKRGVLIVVGGPQYRVGSHRQFTLLARYLAKNGIPVFRFDYRGMGDSQGKLRDFEEIREDIKTAIDLFTEYVPSLQSITLWGLCDAASAACFYADSGSKNNGSQICDPRVTKLVLLNPWVRTDEGEAKAYLKHYYIKRLLDASFWRAIFSGKINVVAAIRSLIQQFFIVLGLTKAHKQDLNDNSQTDVTVNSRDKKQPLPDRMYTGLKAFKGKVLLVLSGEDLTADEFRDLVKSNKKWKKLINQPNIETREIAGANHTFASQQWRSQVEEMTKSWVFAD